MGKMMTPKNRDCCCMSCRKDLSDQDIVANKIAVVQWPSAEFRYKDYLCWDCLHTTRDFWNLMRSWKDMTEFRNRLQKRSSREGE